MHADPAYNAGMTKIQYTIRGIPARLDARIRERALKEGRPLNEILVEALKVGVGLSGSPVRYADLDDLAGTWINDPEFDRAIQEMHQVDPELWK